METLGQLGNIPFGVSALATVFSGNKAIVAKASRLANEGRLIRLKKGVYLVDPNFSKKRIHEFLIANHLNGPSYVSMHTALRYYGLIPERVYEISSMTTRYTKKFRNKYGLYSYIHCSPEYFNIGLTLIQEEGVTFMMATPEKALCDLMIYTSGLNLRYKKEISRFLEENMRIDISQLSKFNLELLNEIRDKGKKKQMITQLIKYIADGRNI